MIKWLIIAGVGIILVLAIVLAVIVSRKKGKKKNLKLDENIKKLKSEQEQLTIKQQKEEEQKKEEEAFANITLTGDVEDEFADLFVEPKKEEPAFNPSEKQPVNNDFMVKNNKSMKEMNNLFFGDKEAKKPKKKSRDEEFEDFLNEHSYSRRLLDKDLLEQIKNLPPKIKAIVLGNVFNKFED